MTKNDISTKQEYLDLLLGDQSKELGLSDLIKVQEKFKDPLVLSVIIYKLIEERKNTNKILNDLNRKYDELQFLLKNNNQQKQKENYKILSEVDDKIISYVRSKGKVDALKVKEKFNYKGTNAASQRLNKLAKEKYLQKIQAGRKVYFVVR